MWIRSKSKAVGLLTRVVASCLLATAAAEAEDTGDPQLPWLDNEYYKIDLDVRARIELATIDGFQESQAYTIRTRAGLGTRPLYGFSALAELENTWSLADNEYFDGVETPNGKSLIADPENTELNQAWLQYASDGFLGSPVGVKAKGGIQRIILDDARFIGNVGWRQNEQTFDAALGETNLSIEGLTAQYAYLWRIQRIFGDKGPTNATLDWSSESNLARLDYTGFEKLDLTAFAYLLDFKSDNPIGSSNSYGVRGAGSLPFGDEWSLAYALSYAYQTDAGDNPVDYGAHYVWVSADAKYALLGAVGLGFEMLGSDDGKAVFQTPLATAHKFNGFADAFLNNGGPRGLKDLFFSVSPSLPWKLEGLLVYHEFWRADGGAHRGRELDAVLSRPINSYLTALTKFAWFDGTSRGPADRWRLTFQVDFEF